MVDNGNSYEDGGVAVGTFEGDRIYLPPRFVKQIGLAKNETKVDCWLLVVNPGRFRLLRRPTGTATGVLSKITDQGKEVAAPGDELDEIANNPRAAIRARLIPCIASSRGPGWRITVPKVARNLARDGEKSSFVFLLIVAGFVEVWFPDTLREAASVPISDLLP